MYLKKSDYETTDYIKFDANSEMSIGDFKSKWRIASKKGKPLVQLYSYKPRQVVENNEFWNFLGEIFSSLAGIEKIKYNFYFPLVQV